MDLNPCDSISNHEVDTMSTLLSPVVSPSFLLDIFKGVTSQSHVTSLTPFAMKVCELYSSYLQVVASVSSPVGSAVNSATVSATPPVSVSPAVSVSPSRGSLSSSGGSAGSFVSKSKLRSSRRAAAWRKQTVPKTFPKGYCYARCFTSLARESVGCHLQAWPTIQSVLLQPVDLALHPCLLDDFKLVSVGEGRYHVAAPHELAVKTDGVPLVDALIGVSRRYEYAVGTFGHLLRTDPRTDILPSVASLLVQGDLLGGADDSVTWRQNRKFKRDVQHGRVAVEVGSRFRDPSCAVDLIRQLSLNVPEVFDCIQMVDSGTGLVSCSAREPTDQERSEFFECFSDYVHEDLDDVRWYYCMRAECVHEGHDLSCAPVRCTGLLSVS